MSNAITASKREQTGSLNALRRDGKIPAVLYGKGITPQLLTVRENEAQKGIELNSFIDLKVNGQTHRVMVRDIQKDPIKSSLLHIDFLKVEMNHPLEAEVSIRLTGEAPGVKGGGVLQHQLRSAVVKALPSSIPEVLEANVSSLQIGDSVTVEDLKIPEDVELLHITPETVIASVVPPAKAEEETEETEELSDTDKTE
ncbi:50S ribosomal protein L25 [Thermoactinomyces mirandus]|uniref:Large ribosomal subunit protein bL25 n=1 Tax=Thermoactinomyces mirandus TaxID=2756294 RepID=A0A7W2APS6_9BACL|nr:50S ribosomal protein L25 [Thermoactinomyces mirandus]MBA4601249.1 50S ribosomal protein L25 [Thermoactinomyces mirandus]